VTILQEPIPGSLAFHRTVDSDGRMNMKYENMLDGLAEKSDPSSFKIEFIYYSIPYIEN